MSLLNPLAPAWRPATEPRCCWPPLPPWWMGPLAVACKRLLLARAVLPALREPALVEDIAAHLRGRAPLRFTHAAPTLIATADDSGATARKAPADRWGHYRSGLAFCKAAAGDADPPPGCGWDALGSIRNGMLTGRHFAVFTIVHRGGWLRVGVTPPWLAQAFQAGGTSASGQDGCWAFNTALGQLAHGREHSEWAGQECADTGDEIGLLLDLGGGATGEGSLTVYKNGARLGVMVPQGAGLGGPLCWCVELHDAADVVRVAERPDPEPPG
jgi:hypothetical protein